MQAVFSRVNDLLTGFCKAPLGLQTEGGKKCFLSSRRFTSANEYIKLVSSKMQATFCLLKSNTVFFNFPPQGFLWWKIKIPPACSSVFRDRECTFLNPSTMASYKATDLLHANCALLKHSLYLSESNHRTCTIYKLTMNVFFFFFKRIILCD